MTDDERVVALQHAIMSAVNGSSLPLSVKALAVENLLLRVQAAMTTQIAIAQKEASQEAQPEKDPGADSSEPEKEE